MTDMTDLDLDLAADVVDVGIIWHGGKVKV